MPSYSKLKVAELRQLCDARDVDHVGLTKPQLIDALRHFDLTQTVPVGEEENGGLDDQGCGDDGEVDDVESSEDDAEDDVDDGSDESDEGSDNYGRIATPPSRSSHGGGFDPAGTQTVNWDYQLEMARLRDREAERQAERERRAEAREAREAARVAREREWEIEQARWTLMGGSQPPTGHRNPAQDFSHIRGLLPKMADDDVLAFFQGYEHTLLCNDVDRSLWIKFLSAQLSSKAIRAFSRLSPDDRLDYDVVKTAILAYYRLDAQAYLKVFRKLRRSGNETYKMALSRMRDALSDFCESKKIDTFEALFDAILTEQFLNSLSDDVRQFVWAKEPKTAAECSQYADLCFEVSQVGTGLHKHQNQPRFHAHTDQHQNKREAERVNGKGLFHAKGKPPKSNTQGKLRACFLCNSTTHLSHSCPQNTFKAQLCMSCGKYHAPNVNCAGKSATGVYSTVACDNTLDERYVIPMYVNGQEVTALRDTGNNGPILVDKALVSEGQFVPNKFLYCKGAFDGLIGAHKLPVAVVKIRSPRFNCDHDISAEVAVCHHMPNGINCNVGNRFFRDHADVQDMILIRPPKDRATPDETTPDETAGGATAIIDHDGLTATAAQRGVKPCTHADIQVVTRSMGRQREQTKQTDTAMNIDCDKTGLNADPDTTRPSGTNQEQIKHGNDSVEQTATQMGNIDVSPTETVGGLQPPVSEFQAAQRNDPSLANLWGRAEAGHADVRVIEGLLYKVAPAHLLTTHEFLLVLPTTYAQEVIRMVHDLPSGGHMGARKSYDRLRAIYYFPKMWRKVKRYVKCCRQCQVTAPRRAHERQPLQPIEIMRTHPFDDLSIDVMGGDLARTTRGNRYLLVIVCNVSKWVHAVPMRNLRAETVADKLIEFFAISGLPRIIRSDNMAGFRSQLMTKLRERLNIQANFSAPFHFQSHGGVERANLTIETMLRKFLIEHAKNWDLLLPFLMFALRETVHSGTKFSPNELVFGRKLRGLLEVARETWTDGDPAQKQLNMPTVKYIERLNANIQLALKAAHQNMSQAQEQMKRNYDKVSSIRELNPGEMALILLPTTGNKLMARWRGPYQILRRLDNNNYELQIGRRKAVMHINSLRKFHTADDPETETGAAGVNMIITDDATIDGEPLGPITLETQEGSKEYVIGSQLTATQRQQMEQLLAQYPDVFSDKPGKTDVVEHVIRVTDDKPCYQPAYKIPESMRDAVEAELMKMLENKILQYDPHTNWNSPLIIVKKSDGQIRLVNNFINLNKKTVNDQYTMNNMSDLLSRVAGARYLTKIDLRQSFFQVPLSKESRKFTGFQTHIGTFSYRMMPMGLKCASATCQRMIDIVLRGAHRYTGSLLDDILVFSKHYDSHLAHVTDVLERLRKSGLTVNTKKCHFASNNVKILGHIVKDGLIYPNDEKIEVIKTWPVPRTKKHLKSFLGLVGFFRDYVPHFATVAYPLTELLAHSKPDKLAWDKSHQMAFDCLRNALMSKPVLRPPDPTKGYIITADTSSVALSAILMQRGDGDATSYVISYASRKLLPREQKYPIVELELMAIVFGLKKFNHWVYGRPIEVFTDHRPLQWLNSLTKHSARLARWSLVLQNYDITTSYISGDKQLADCLTRLE